MVKFLDEHKILLETLVPSDWTWGCELEGFIRKENYNEIFNTSYGDYDEDPDYDELCSYFDEKVHGYCDCVTQEGDVHGDGSLHPDDDEFAFEYATPVFKTLPSEYDGFCDFLNDIIAEGDFYTTTACGFHHHLMYNGMNERDCIWIYCNLAMDDEFIETTKNFDDFSLYSSGWADDRALRLIRKYINENNFSNVLDYLSTEKYRLFRIHPQGTLEWRGPRNFLNRGVIKIIKKFYYQHLPIIINRFIEYNRSNVLTNTQLTKEEFFNKLKEAQSNKDRYYRNELGNNEFILNSEGTYKNKNKNPFLERRKEIDYDTFYKVWKKLTDKPYIFTKIVKGNDKFLPQILNRHLLNTNDFKEVIKKCVSGDLIGMTLKEFSKRIMDAFVKNGLSYEDLINSRSNIGSTIISYLDTSLSKEDLLGYLENSSGEKAKTIFIKLLKDNLINVREAEEILYNHMNILNYINSDDISLIKFNGNLNDTIKFCFFILKLCYQKNYCDNQSLFVGIRDIITLANNDIQSKWNNMAIGITINKDVRFAKLIISLKPEEYVRLSAEYPNIDEYLGYHVLSSIPDDIKNKINYLRAH